MNVEKTKIWYLFSFRWWGTDDMTLDLAVLAKQLFLEQRLLTRGRSGHKSATTLSLTNKARRGEACTVVSDDDEVDCSLFISDEEAGREERDRVPCLIATAA